jgi:DNA repair protein RadC
MEKKPNIHTGHRQRLKDKYLRGGLDMLADHEALELLLFYAVKQGNVNPLAHRIIKEFGSIRAVLEAAPETIANTCGISVSTAILISLALPLVKRYETAKWGNVKKLSNSADACEFAKDLFLGETNEILYMICLNTQNKVLSCVDIARGTIDKAPIYPRLVVEKALQHNAASVILAHNHPSGNLQPSQSDIKVTNFLKGLLEKVEVVVTDHIVVGGNKTMSFAEKKLLDF